MELKIDSQLIDYLDSDNRRYFLSLAIKTINKTKNKTLRIHVGNASTPATTEAYPTSIAPPELLKYLPVEKYSSLREQPDLIFAAQSAHLWIKKMQAGSGSSILRKNYLSKLRKLPESEVKIGAKGTDLYTTINGKRLSLAELQILQMISAAQNGSFAKVSFHDIVSSETDAAIQNLWSTPTHFSSPHSYIDWIKTQKNISHFGKTYQAYLPTLNEEAEWTCNRIAPGGHAFFGVDALLAATDTQHLPDKSEKKLIGIIANGEDLCATPDSYMVGWMLKNSIPIAMVTTDKTFLDMKGGMISLIPNGNPNQIPIVTLLELAQAKAAGQEQLFYDLGLRSTDPKAFFNTNMVLINYQVLIPILQDLFQRMGLTQFMEIISPDLIENWKTQLDSDGKTRKYLQLEGAMGSTFLNLDKYWRENFGKPLVHFLNVESQFRTQFFSPIKTPIDFILQFYSDRFLLDENTYRLIDQRPGTLPKIELLDSFSQNQYYNDMESVRMSFTGTSLLNLDSLKVEGKVDFSEMTLEGEIEITNQNPEPLALKNILKDKRILKNIKLVFNSQKQLSH